MVARHSRRESGQSMVWSAIVMMTVVVPLLMLVTDGSRLLHVRNRVQTALDAACEDAAWQAADLAHFRETGEVTFQSGWRVLASAHATFSNVLGERYRMNYQASMHVQPDYSQAIMYCDAQANVPFLLAFGSKTIHFVSQSQIRFSR